MKIFSVSELNLKVGALLQNSFEHPIMIKGEVTGTRKYPNGNQYCRLSENSGLKLYAVDCAILSWENTQKINITDYENLEVLITGEVNLYQPNGKFQIKIHEIVEYGEGFLKKKIEQVRKKLESEGLFEHKKEIPSFPEIIGVVTSQQGDALHDVTTIIKKRYPVAKVFIYPSTVQGEMAARSIIKQIKHANSDNEADVLLIVRGGGSLQDLMPFNDEGVAREIYSSKIPIITGIGHQPDKTIADYVSDLAAETPTHAATSATPDKNDLYQRLAEIENLFLSQIKLKLEKSENLVKQTVTSLGVYNPEKIIKNMVVEYKNTLRRILNNFKNILGFVRDKNKNINLKINQSNKIIKQKILSLSERHVNIRRQLDFQILKIYEIKKQNFSGAFAEISNCNPKKILKKGYSIIRNKGRKIIKSKIEFDKAPIFSAEFHDGETLIKKR